MEFSVVSRAKRGIKKEERRERKEGRKKGNSFRHRTHGARGLKRRTKFFLLTGRGWKGGWVGWRDSDLRARSLSRGKSFRRTRKGRKNDVARYRKAR